MRESNPIIGTLSEIGDIKDIQIKLRKEITLDQAQAGLESHPNENDDYDYGSNK